MAGSHGKPSTAVLSARILRIGTKARNLIPDLYHGAIGTMKHKIALQLCSLRRILALIILCATKRHYFITDANSKGIRTVIFFAEYDRKDATIYIELAGNEKDGKQLSEKLSEALFNMIKSNAPDISAVKFELQ